MHRFENLRDDQKALLIGIGCILMGGIVFAIYYADFSFFTRTSRLVSAWILEILGIGLVVISIMIRRSK